MAFVPCLARDKDHQSLSFSRSTSQPQLQRRRPNKSRLFFWLFMNGQNALRFLHPLLPSTNISVSTYEAMSVDPREQSVLALLRPKLLWPPPFKQRQTTLARIARQARRNVIPFCKMRPAFAFGHNVVNCQLFVPRSAIGTGTVTKRPFGRKILENTSSITSFSFARA